MRTSTLVAALLMVAATPAFAQDQSPAPTPAPAPAIAPAQNQGDGQAQNQACTSNPADFPQWLEGVKKDAAAQGIGAQGLAALDGVTYDQNVISHDRGGQKVFKQSFEEFSGRMVNAFRIKRGQQVIKKYQAVFDKAEQEYGVQPAIIASLWALETDFGANVGKFDSIRSLATLAFDCRRADKFRPELIDALKIVDEGDVPLSEMKGAWAGEIGQVQFLPSSYLKHAVDFDGDGRKDLVKSQADVIGSVAKFLADGGWQRDAGWEPGEPNFDALKSWNGSELYRKTVALLATKIAEGQQ